MEVLRQACRIWGGKGTVHTSPTSGGDYTDYKDYPDFTDLLFSVNTWASARLAPTPVFRVIPRVIIRWPLQDLWPEGGCLGSQVRSPVSVY